MEIIFQVVYCRGGQVGKVSSRKSSFKKK